MSDFNWNNVSRNKQVISLLKEREEIEEQIKTIDKFSLVKYEYEKLGLDPTNEDIIEAEKALATQDVGKRFLTITEALGYLNRGGHDFKERMMLSDETIIVIANEIFETQKLNKN